MDNLQKMLEGLDLRVMSGTGPGASAGPLVRRENGDTACVDHAGT